MPRRRAHSFTARTVARNASGSGTSRSSASATRAPLSDRTPSASSASSSASSDVSTAAGGSGNAVSPRVTNSMSIFTPRTLHLTTGVYASRTGRSAVTSGSAASAATNSVKNMPRVTPAGAITRQSMSAAVSCTPRAYDPNGVMRILVEWDAPHVSSAAVRCARAAVRAAAPAALSTPPASATYSASASAAAASRALGAAVEMGAGMV